VTAWKPTTRQLETIADMGNARAPVDRIAAALGIKPEEFMAWTGRLAATRTLDVDALYRAPPPPSCRHEKATPRVIADRVFETASEDDALLGLAAECRRDVHQ
jgi:hypothetical protein